MERENYHMQKVQADADRLISLLANQEQNEAGFTNVCVDGPNRDQPASPFLLVGIYPTYPQYRAVAINDEAQGIGGDEIRNKILTYNIREDYLRRHRAIVSEFITMDTHPNTFEGKTMRDFANMRAEITGLPVFFFTFSKYISDNAEVTHMYFQEHMMPDELLGKVQQFIRDRAEGKTSKIL